MDSVLTRLGKPAWNQTAVAIEYQPRVQAAAKAIRDADAAENAAAAATNVAQQRVEQAKGDIRDQLEVDYGSLLQTFKSEHARAERFFKPRKAGGKSKKKNVVENEAEPK